jgi:hypothetical protein
VACPVPPDPILSVLSAWLGGLLLGAAGREGIRTGLRRFGAWFARLRRLPGRDAGDRSCPVCRYPRRAVRRPGGPVLLGACPRCADPPRTLA